MIAQPTEADTINRVELSGFVSRSPVLRYTPAGVPVLTFSLLTYHWREEDGLPEPVAERHLIVAWHALAESQRYLTPGAFVRVSGRLQPRAWEDRRGEKHWTTEVVATQVDLIQAPHRSQQGRLLLEAGV